MRRYNPSEIEPKWQKIWQDRRMYEADLKASEPKIYVSGMFPYPSGAGMHTGHAFSYSIVDAIARFHRQLGYNVLNPMGWDTFGLPAENYAIKTGTAPAEITKINIENFKKQFKRMGVSIDWSREINTSDPEYYKWTQWIFTKLFERGLAYQKESLQWWCPVDKTVLANEQVEAGKCWRCGNLVEKRSMTQWFFKITEYADELLDEIDNLDWPQKVKTAQRNWIGKSDGANISFNIEDSDKYVTVFSTRPDTLFGASFIVLAPEHELIKDITKKENLKEVTEYIDNAVKRSEIDRMSDSGDKTGVFTGRYALNPANGKRVPIWVSDYVLYGYGSGAVMAVPAHDVRDNQFAHKFDLPIIEVIDQPEDDSSMGVYSGEGTMINSGQFDGRDSSEVREEIVSWLEQQKFGVSETTYKMRDWLISRQRYWGAPIPIIHCSEHGAVPVPERDLPVILPEVKDYKPKGDGKSTLASVEDWVNVECPICSKPAKRETDTMDGYACSSWYLLRYTDPRNSSQAWDAEKANYWSPVDYYVGGDHAVAHLLYVRFWSHVFHDMGLIDFKEPVKTLLYHGYINAEDGSKMSKSKGNVIDPLDIIDQGYGADALRTYVLFMSPIEQNAPWDPNGLAGVYRFLNRVWSLTQEYLEAGDSGNVSVDKELERTLHKTIRRVTDDYRRHSFNTAVSAMMELVNYMYKTKADMHKLGNWSDTLSGLVLLLAPLAPHMSAELWSNLGHESTIEESGWPTWDESKLASDSMTIIVQVNGKLRAKIEFSTDASEDEIKTSAISHSHVKSFIENKQVRKTIYVPGKIINIVV